MASPLRLLVVDDDDVDRLAVKRLLRRVRPGAAIEECTDQASAMAALERGDIACVLLDYNIPGTDGLRILESIRQAGHDVPIIMLTGQGDEELAVSLMKAGASDYLNKNTLSADRLERSLRYALDLHKADRERAQLLEREQRAREEAQAANRAKDEFLATLSHELRTPLNAILGWSRLLASGTLDPDAARRAIEVIDRNTRLQAQLIEDLLDISRIITGKLRLELRVTPLGAVIEAALESVRPAADAKRIRIEADPAGSAEAVFCDAARMQQVVWNLLTNAVKFTPEGGCVTIGMTRQDATVTIHVSDTGMGIEPEFLPHVFDRFRQQDAASTRAHGGLGIGLSIARHLVELHGGTIEALSAGVGRGATFLVRVPAAAEPAPIERAVTPPLAGGDVPSLAGLRVLIVDDEADTRGLMRTVLEKFGATVDEAPGAAEALAMIRERRPDVLLSDIAMPLEDGYALIRQVRALDDSGRALPAAAFTAFATAQDRARALLAGFQAHIPKPVEPSELAAVVAALAGRTIVKN
jgi:signal transduction histidine kinase